MTALISGKQNAIVDITAQKDNDKDENGRENAHAIEQHGFVQDNDIEIIEVRFPTSHKKEGDGVLKTRTKTKKNIMTENMLKTKKQRGKSYEESKENTNPASSIGNKWSRYGKERKKTNVSLAALWGTEFKQRSKSASTPTELRSTKHKKKAAKRIQKDTKKKNKRKKQLTAEQERELAETFFMTKSEKKQYQRDKVMTKFAMEISQRQSEDQRLFGGKKVNPYFEIAKQRQLFVGQLPKIKKAKSTESELIPLAVFPEISSVQPPLSEHNVLNMQKYENEFEVKIQDLIQTAILNDDHEMSHTKQQTDSGGTAVKAVMDKSLHFEQCNIDKQAFDESSVSTQRYTYHWTSFEAFKNYCDSSEFRNFVSQIRREFPQIDHQTIKNDLMMCLNRTGIYDKKNAIQLNSMWCDKYTPLDTTQVIGNFEKATELKRWLKAWRNTGKEMEYDMNEHRDSDEAWIPNTYKNSQLGNTSLLTGPIACGKTSCVYAVATELNYKVIEVNLARIETGKDLNDLIGEATQSRQVTKTCSSSLLNPGSNKIKKNKKSPKYQKKSQGQRSIVLLLEEVDTLLETIPSIIKPIAHFIKHSRCPIILTAHCVPDALKNLGLNNLEFQHGLLERLALRTYIIALAEGICSTRREIEKIIQFFDFDLRSVLINLQFWASPRRFDHFYPIPSQSMALRPSQRKHKQTPKDDESIFQRIIGFADILNNSCSANGDCAGTKQHDLNDHLYCFVQDVLTNDFMEDIIFTNFQYWFFKDMNSILLNTDSSDTNVISLGCNSNPFTHTFTRNPAIAAAQSVIGSILSCIFEQNHVDKNREEKNLNEDQNFPTHHANVKLNEYNMEWLENWSIMTDALSDNDIVHQPRGSCLNSTYHDRLYPHTSAIFDAPLDIMWESCKHEPYSNPYYLDAINPCHSSSNHANHSRRYHEKNKNKRLCSRLTSTKRKLQHATQLRIDKKNEFDTNFCQIYDTIQHDYLKVHVSPYLVSTAIQICNHRREKDAKGTKNKCKLEYFISTICVNEYYCKIKSGPQYRKGREILRSQMNRSVCLEHILAEWCGTNDTKGNPLKTLRL